MSMVFRRVQPTAEVAQLDPPRLPEIPSDMRALVAAAATVKLDEGSVTRSAIRDEDWQREAWRHYDLNGELRFASNRHAAALSQCRLYVAEVDKKGAPGKEVTEERIQTLGETLFGGPAAKAEALRTLGVCFYVGGEAYIVAEGATNPKKDVWYVVTANQIKRNGGQYKVDRPQIHGGGKATLKPGQDLLMRAWTPHPRKFDLADSPTRSVLPNLREIERLTQLTFSQIDSRLISAGLLLFPKGTSFPKADGSQGGLQDLFEMMLEVARAQLTGAGTAAGVLPILAEVPEDASQRPEHITFDTPLQKELADKLEQAIRRLATGLDIAPEELLGQGDANHWGAWQIDESGLKLFIQPVMTRLCDALTQGYLYPALKALGVAEPEKYTLWFDTSPLAVRPNRFEDASGLYDKGVIDAKELRKAGNFSEESAPTGNDLAVINARWAVGLDPSLLQQEAYAKLLGLPVSEPPPPPAPPGMGPDGGGPQGDTPDQPDAAGGGRASQIKQQLGLPKTASGGASPAQKGLTASGAMLPAAEQLVLRALELAGSRMLTGKGRNSLRGQYADVPKHELHTRIHPTDRAHARKLLDGAFTHTVAMTAHFSQANPTDLTVLLEKYCIELLVRGYAHHPDFLQATLAAALQEPVYAAA